jgi:hypothetical protein
MRLLFVPLFIGLASATMSHAAPDLQNLDPGTCNQYLSIHSANSDTALQDVEFENMTSETRTIAWINYEGGVVHYSTLDSGQTFAVDTYLTHPWLIIDNNGKCRAMYLAGSPGAKIMLRD